VSCFISKYIHPQERIKVKLYFPSLIVNYMLLRAGIYELTLGFDQNNYVSS